VRELACDREAIATRLQDFLASSTREVLERLYPGTLPK
jgi:hypothetical protein